MSNPYCSRDDAEYGKEERERLILEHLPQVRLIARRIRDRLPENVSLEDLVSAGIVGLIAAVDQYDPSHNVKLKTYAEHRIRGAILDSLRGLDWAPRQRRKKAKQIETAISRAEQRLRRAPGEEEIAAEMGLDLEEYHRWLVEVQGLNIGSLEYTSDGAEGKGLLEYLSDDQDRLPSRVVERAQLDSPSVGCHSPDTGYGTNGARALLPRRTHFAGDRASGESA